MTEPTAEQPQVTATVSPAAPPRSRLAAIPHHLGRARTSTVVLSLLFLAVGALWINVRPEQPPPPAVVVDEPVAPPAAPAVPPTPGPATDPAPTTSEAPTTSGAPTMSSPADSTPRETSSRFPAPAPEPSTSPLAPTSTPTG